MQCVVYRAEPNALRRRLRLTGLEADAEYREDNEEGVFSGAALMAGGILLPPIEGDDVAVQFHFRRV